MYIKDMLCIKERKGKRGGRGGVGIYILFEDQIEDEEGLRFGSN